MDGVKRAVRRGGFGVSQEGKGTICLEGQYNALWYRSDHLALMLLNTQAYSSQAWGKRYRDLHSDLTAEI